MNSPPLPHSKQSATQRAYLALKEEIITGEIAPGMRLKVEKLMVHLEMGASPVREALSLLTSDQLVERLDQRGFRVAKTSQKQFQEILDLRANLEVMAIQESIRRGDLAWENRLVLTHHHMARADRGNSLLFEALHKDFHMTLLGACDSPILLRMCHQLYDLNVRYRFLAAKSDSYVRRNIDVEHKAILEASIDRDSDKASNLLLIHYKKTGAFLSELIS